MSIAWLVVLVLGIVAIVQGIRHQEYNNAVFWFLIAFWAYLVLGPVVGHFVAIT
jgi:Ca2+/Na+ antiporter